MAAFWRHNLTKLGCQKTQINGYSHITVEIFSLPFISEAYKGKDDSPDRVQTALHQAMSMD